MQTTVWIIAAGVGVIGLVVIPLLYAIWEATKTQIASNRKLYAKVADQFDGTVVEGMNRFAPAIQFLHGKIEARVDTAAYASSEAAYYTRFRIPWPDHRLRCEIHARHWMHRLRRLLYMDDIVSDDQRFDESFFVIGNEHDSIRAMLNDEARSTIRSLSKLRYDDRVFIAIQGGTFEIRKSGFIDYYDTLLRFVHLSIELYDNMVATSGIVFGEAVEECSWSSDGGHCLVCGEPLTSKVIYCRDCQTPHHADCWEYFGGCATYGCQGRHASPRKRVFRFVGHRGVRPRH